MEDYPSISISTPLFNRTKWKALMISNILNLHYPKEKLEWVIFDSYDKHEEDWDLFFKNDRERKEMEALLGIKIKYIKSITSYTIGEKRNKITKEASHKIIANQDSDDVMIGSWLKHSIDIMRSDKRCGVVGTPEMVFCFPDDDYKLTGISCPEKRMIHEGAMLYTKKHWKCMGGFKKKGFGEGTSMVDFNEKSCLTTKAQDCIICICHDGNTVNKDRFREHIIPEAKLGKKIIVILDEILSK